MKLYEKRILRNILLPLIAVIVLIGMFYIKSHGKQLQIEFEKLIIEDDLSLTIYYMNPLSRLRYPMNDIRLINGGYEHKVTIQSNQLKEHINLLNQVNNITLRPVIFKFYPNTRLFYEFKTKKGDRVLSVSMQGVSKYMYVNGHRVKANDLFYEIIMPFLQNDEVEVLHKLMEEIKWPE